MTSIEAKDGSAKVAVCTGFALAAFAANSVICRLALDEATIDAGSYSTIRLVSGAVTLLLITAVFKKKRLSGSWGNWPSAIMLFLYAAAFSFAYIKLSTGVGALILFGMVQMTMILAALRSGERPHLPEWIGLFLALMGLVYLVFPGLTAPSPTGAALMGIAGISWGVYSLWGRGAVDPLAETTKNFILSLPFVLVVSVITIRNIHVSAAGILLSALSGSLASGVGYVIWYVALRELTATRAAIVQLSVPVLAALGGVVFLSEEISIRLLLSSIMILGGIGLAVIGREHLFRLRAKQ